MNSGSYITLYFGAGALGSALDATGMDVARIVSMDVLLPLQEPVVIRISPVLPTVLLVVMFLSLNSRGLSFSRPHGKHLQTGQGTRLSVLMVP